MAEGAGVVCGEGGDLLPALGRVAPEDAAGGDGNRGPVVGVVAGELPRAVPAEREADQVGAVRVGMEFDGFLLEGGPGEGLHVRVGPIGGNGALRHDDDEGPAVGVIADGLGKANLRLPHTLSATLSAAVEEEDNGPLFAIVAAPLLREIDLKAIGDAMELDAPIEEAGFLEMGLGRLGTAYLQFSLDGGSGGCGGNGGGRRRYEPGNAQCICEANNDVSKKREHD